MTYDLIDIFVFFLFVALACTVIIMVLVRLLPQQRAQWSLAGKPGYEGPAIAARSRIRERFVYLWICGVFLIIGLIQVLPHERYDPIWLFGILAILSIMVRMILAILAGDRDNEEALKAHTELK